MISLIWPGGLKPDATDFGYIRRENLQNPKEIEIIRVDIAAALATPGGAYDILIAPNDRLNAFSKVNFTDEFQVQVLGAVRKPGEYTWSPTLELQDVLTLAGGLQLSASKSRIEISRLVLNQDSPTETIVATVEVNDQLEVEGADGLTLEPFDIIYVRDIPEFELQKNIRLEGEVRYPGTYPLLSDNEQLMSVIQRAGGLTREAFEQGATLLRTDNDKGFVILNLDKAKKNPQSRFNYILKKGDVITIPKLEDLVTVEMANTRSAELYPDKLTDRGKFNVAWQRGKRANYYVKSYTAGLGERGRKRLITVEHANGELGRTVNLGLFKISPKVRPGSIVSVGAKAVKPEEEKRKKEKEPVDWEKVVANTIAQATTVLSLILLVQNISN